MIVRPVQCIMTNLAIPVLLYHRIGTGPNSTAPDVFREHMRILYSQGIKVLSLQQFERTLAGELIQDCPSVYITFDDGSRTGLTEALPVLSRFNFNATSFLITGRMAGNSAYSDALSWEEVRELQSSGRFSFQSHSHTHSRWERDEAGRVSVRNEFENSRLTLVKELGGSLADYRHLAWPWGRCFPEFEAIGLELGFSFQYLVQKGAVRRAGDRLRLPRLCCDGMSVTAFERWIGILTSKRWSGAVNTIYGSLRGFRHGLAYT